MINWQPLPSQFDLKEHEVHVYRLDMDASLNELDACKAVLSDEELESANRFYFEKDQQYYTLSRANLRFVLSRYLNVQPSLIRFEKGEHGKLFLPDYPEVQFNVTHSKDLALYALTSIHVIGVDTEYAKKPVEYYELAERFFAENEAEKMQGLKGKDLQTAFFNAWTRKEAFIKAVGEGLSFPLKEFEITLLPSENPALLNVKGSIEAANDWAMKSFVPREDYIAAIATKQFVEDVRFYQC